MTEDRRITKREERDAELRMTGRRPAAAGFIGFVPSVLEPESCQVCDGVTGHKIGCPEMDNPR